ncbi:MAG TPA: hypothetical protein VFU81_21520 [Thermomicrobiales bacterium]|nr:hypothetical protein [Thermomicrobiales bacterium]
MYDAPIFAWILVLMGAIGVPAITCVALFRSGTAAGLSRQSAIGVAAGFGVALGGWLALSGALAGAGAYENGLLIAATGALLALLLATRFPLVSRILAQPGGIAWFTWPHALRVVGIVWLLLLARGDLPAGFAVPAGLGDIAVGLAAPFVARELARSTDSAAITRATRFHLFGLLDLAVAVAAATAVAPSPGSFFAVGPSLAALSLLPLALNVTVAVPLFVALHLVSLRQLRAAARINASAGGKRQTGQLGSVRA